MSTRKLSKTRKNDPFFERECQKYEIPLPSREYTMQLLQDQGRPVSFDQLVALLDISRDEEDLFQRRLNAMERDGQLLRNRKNSYILPEKADLIPGKVEGHPDGFGFVKPDDGSDDLFLEPKQMDKVLHGDRVLVRCIGLDRRGRREATIVEVLERANTRLVGRLMEEHGIQFVVAENKRISQDILIPPTAMTDKRAKLKARPGNVVMVEILEQPSRYSQPIGRIVEILGNYADPGMEIEIALRKHDLPFEFSKEAQAENKAVPDKVKKSDFKGREDLRELPLVTIDGETARDFDDAVFCEKVGRGWRLVVAIADVSHYVRPGMALDQEAYDRGNSVYFPRRVIPMLPEKLSNGICSLNPDVERLAMVCDMNISATGSIGKYPLLSGRVPLPCPPNLQPGVGLAVWPKPAGERGASGPAAPPAEPLQALPGAAQGAQEAGCHRLRDGGNPDAVQRPGQNREHRARGAQRRPPPDRGMHAGGQRLRLRLPA